MLRIARLPVDGLLKFGQDRRHPPVVARHPPVEMRGLDRHVLHVRLQVETRQRQVVLGEQHAARVVHHRPVSVVQLLDELVEHAVRPLRVDDQLEKREAVALPVAPALHLVRVVADPVVVADDRLAVQEDEPTVRRHHVAQRLHEEPDVLALGG